MTSTILRRLYSLAQRRTLSAFETILLNQRQSTTGLGLAHGKGDLGSKVRSFSTFRELQPEGTYGIQTRSLHMKSGPLDYRSSFALQAALAGNYSYEESSKKAADDDGLEISPEIVSALAKKGITKLFPIQKAGLEPAMQGHDMIGRARTGAERLLFLEFQSWIKSFATI